MKPKHLSILSFYSLLIALISCSSEGPIKSSGERISIDLFSTDTTLSELDSKLDNLSIIPLQTSEECLIQYVNQLDKLDEQLIIREGKSKKIMVFNLDGSYSHLIGNIGKGPGEYIYPFGFSINRGLKEILAFDTRRKVAIFYNYAGEFLREFKVKSYGTKMAYLNDTLFAVHGGRLGYIGQIDQHFELWRTNNQGETVDSLFHYMDALGLGYGTTFIPSHRSGSVLYAKMGDYCIYEVKAESIDTLYHIDFGPANIDTARVLYQKHLDELFNSPDKIMGFAKISNTLIDLTFSVQMNDRWKQTVVINHKTRNVASYPTDTLSFGKYFGLPMPLPKWGDDEYHYSSLSADNWLEVLEGFSEEEKAVLRKEITGFSEAEKIDVEDNPLVFRFKFKAF